MTRRILIRRSLRFYWRAHLGVLLGATIGSASLIGALLVGDSVRQSLRERALARLGNVWFALSTGDRLFSNSLPDRLTGMSLTSPSLHWSLTTASAALSVTAIAARADEGTRANSVRVLGADPRFFALAESSPHVPANRPGLPEDLVHRWETGEIVMINEPLAKQLGVKENDEILLRLRKPGALAQDAVIAPRADSTLALRLKVGAVLDAKLLGEFSLSANQTPALNVFLPLDFLARKLKLEGQANLVVCASLPADAWFRDRPIRETFAFKPLPVRNSLAWLQDALRRNWTLADAQLAVRAVEPPQDLTGGEHVRPFIEVSSPRIFLDETAVSAALRPRTQLLTNHAEVTTPDTYQELASSQLLVTNAVGVLTYLANLLQAGEQAAPYSMVSALGARWLPAGMADDDILINEWLAEDLKVKPGDSVQLSYYVADSASKLVERTNSFRVREIVPMKGLYADRSLMPEFPGIAEAESTHDWDAGFPLTYKIRDKDEAYWKQYRGTPKAFITLAAGQKMWSNRFGSLTAIRYEVPTNSFATVCREAIYRNLLANLNPEDFGLRFEPVREQALKAAEQSQDFGQLFLGFSIFLVVAALLLMALLFQFGLEQRVSEIGTLLALGFTPKQVRRLFLFEGGALALLGGVFGALAGLAYAKAMLWALTTIWRSAIANSSLQFHASASTLAIGIIASVLVAGLSMWLTLRKQARQPAYALLAGEQISGSGTDIRTRSRPLGGYVAALAGTGAVALLAWAALTAETANAGIFFGAGSLLLISGLGLVSLWLGRLAKSKSAAGVSLASQHFSLTSLGMSACGRRNKRSLATAALLACGSFVIVAIGVFRLEAARESARRDSGTGGFALIGQTTLPVVQDLNTKAGREFFGLSEKDLQGVTFVPFRVREGDEASCLNLNRAQKPRLLGVKPEMLEGRFTFAKIAKGIDRTNGWAALGEKREERSEEKEAENGDQRSSVRAVGDANSIQWALGKKVGDTLDHTDEHGQPFKLRLIGGVANSILQGNLIIDEAQFVQKFPGESGYRMFLIDCPSNQVKIAASTLSRALEDVGLELTQTVERLENFNAVQNTYLGTFQILGGLGLLLGSVGLGIIVLRNVLERRGELGLLLAVGFRRGALQRLVLAEHSALLLAGLAIGILAAAVAVLPAVTSPATHLPYGSLTLTLGAVLLNGALWTWLATKYALRGNLLEALRNE